MARVYGNGSPRGVPGQALSSALSLAQLLLSYNPEFLYLLNETSGVPTDVSGHGAVATLVGSPTQAASGGPNPTMGKLSLNGSSQYWKTDRGTAGADYSLVTHVKSTDTVGVVASSRSAGGQVGLACYMGSAAVSPPASGALALGSSNDGQWNGRKTTAVINDGNWHQLILTVDSTSGSSIPASAFGITIDGVASDTADTSYIASTSPFTGTPWMFGYNTYDNTPSYLTCDMSVTAGFAYVLTAEQKAAIYAASR